MSGTFKTAGWVMSMLKIHCLTIHENGTLFNLFNLFFSG